MTTVLDTAFAADLADFFTRAGAARVETAILQPAEPYLDTAGEALRRRIFLTRGEGGRSLCLRPDFTIPVALAHIAHGRDLPRRYAYDGLVFRQERNGPEEFRQAGIEDLGAADTANADARAVADALGSLAACGVADPSLTVVIGDQGLFEAYLKGLRLPLGWQRRLVGSFGDEARVGTVLEALACGTPAPSSLPSAVLEPAQAGDRAGVVAAVERLLEEGGLPPKRGRSAGEIADRLLEKLAMASSRADADLLARLRRFLAVDVPLKEAVAALNDAGVARSAALDLFETRLQALILAGLDLSRLRYRAAFGRPLDYYTGLVFEIVDPSHGTLVGGGRYDRLVSYLGAPEPIPAIGFALWLDRIGAAKDAAS